jgi:hypothetical protein
MAKNTALRYFEQSENRKENLIKEHKKGERSDFVKDFSRDEFLKKCLINILKLSEKIE